MGAHLHPGVYVEEIPGSARAVEGTGTSTAIFVGEAERGPLTPVRVKSYADYARAFGGFTRHTDTSGSAGRVALAYAVRAFFENGGGDAWILRLVQEASPTAASRVLGAGPTATTLVTASAPGVWGNFLSVVAMPSSDRDPQRFRLVVRYKAPGAAAAEVVETWDRLSLSPADEGYVADVLLRSGYVRWGGATTLPTLDVVATPANPNPTVASTAGVAAPLSGGAGGDGDVTLTSDHLAALDGVEDASQLVVALATALSVGADAATWNTAVAYAEARPRRDLFLVGDLPPQRGATVGAAVQDTADLVRGSLNTSDVAAAYFPYVIVSDPAGVGKNPKIAIPPAGLIAGLYARTDGRRGVWKAPAGVDATLGGALGLEHTLLDAHVDDLNPLGVNALRAVPGAGLVAWGARTTRPSGEWRYVPVRRTAQFLRRSIYNNIQWAVFEPNNTDLWQALRTSVGAFMDQLFRQGAFAGATPKDAYFVRCDASTTPPADQQAGIVNVVVGFAPLRPAEFVVVQLSQKTGQVA